MKFDKINMIYGLIATIGVALFGKYWFLFFGFLVLNAVDYITGYCKAKFYKKNESSAIGAKGILKKVWYWIVIGMAFFVSMSFVHMGEIIGINLSFVQLFGWFTLATYLINEVRSILENLVEYGLDVPYILIKGLAVTERLLNEKSDTVMGTDEEKEGE